ncbi:Cysteine-rich receptor-like protein kinase 10 [Bienertia sinuspersici]
MKFATIRAATGNFSITNKLGKGGFGAVYKGRLPNGQTIAVKRLLRNCGQGEEEFKNEAALVARLQHRNLVKFFGFCLEGEERLLIYELLPNRSLDFFLFDPAKHQHLDWQTRFKIIRGIARGLVYLHEDSRLLVVHRDLKSGNILLDGEMNPKIADFGMASGYMPPEYVNHGHFSFKSDVFSFGVLLLEIITSLRIGSFYHSERGETLLSFVSIILTLVWYTNAS